MQVGGLEQIYVGHADREALSAGKLAEKNTKNKTNSQYTECHTKLQRKMIVIEKMGIKVMIYT